MNAFVVLRCLTLSRYCDIRMLVSKTLKNISKNRKLHWRTFSSRTMALRSTSTAHQSHRCIVGAPESVLQQNLQWRFVVTMAFYCSPLLAHRFCRDSCASYRRRANIPFQTCRCAFYTRRDVITRTCTSARTPLSILISDATCTQELALLRTSLRYWASTTRCVRFCLVTALQPDSVGSSSRGCMAFPGAYGATGSDK